MVDDTRSAASATPVLVRASIACERLSVLLTNFLALSPLLSRGNVMFFVYFIFIFFVLFLLFYSRGLDAHSNALTTTQGKRRNKQRRCQNYLWTRENSCLFPRCHRQIIYHQQEVVFARRKYQAGHTPINSNEENKQKRIRQREAKWWVGIHTGSDRKKGHSEKRREERVKVLCVLFCWRCCIEEGVYLQPQVCSCYDASMDRNYNGHDDSLPTSSSQIRWLDVLLDLMYLALSNLKTWTRRLAYVANLRLP
jgi:hypothetical protein